MNRFFTLLIIPEKTSKIRKMIIPSWLLKGSLIGGLFVAILAIIMLLDYWYIMNRIDENKELKIENRRLRQQVQIYKNRMITIENTMDRIQTFATRLRVITNIEDHDGFLQSLNQKLPDAATNIGQNAASKTNDQEAAAIQSIVEEIDPNDPEKVQLHKDQEMLEEKFEKFNYDTLVSEQSLQDLYELLIDQKAFLSALPTRKPARGYFTSGFGVRKSPYYDGREKMHEGLDIANQPGTPVRAPAYGVVTFANRKPGYGRTVIIDHGYGLETWYAHAWQIMVKLGDKVSRGQKIALMGTSGRSTGSHVHYEVRVHGIPVDPLSYILEDESQ